MKYCLCFVLPHRKQINKGVMLKKKKKNKQTNKNLPYVYMSLEHDRRYPTKGITRRWSYQLRGYPLNHHQTPPM